MGMGQITLFQGISPSGQDRITRSAVVQKITDQPFFHQGDEALHIYILTKGWVKLTQLTREGDQVLLSFLGPRELFGGTPLFGGSVYPATATAVGACEALAWEGKVLGQLVETYPLISQNALKILSSRMVEIQARYCEISTERVSCRLAKALLRLCFPSSGEQGAGSIELPLSRQDIAEMTGTTLYTVSRVLSRWERKGWVKTGREWVSILSPGAIQKITEEEPIEFIP